MSGLRATMLRLLRDKVEGRDDSERVTLAARTIKEIIAELGREEERARCESLTVALLRYGQHRPTCTRQAYRGLCSCGFSRLSDEGGLLDFSESGEAQYGK